MSSTYLRIFSNKSSARVFYKTALITMALGVVFIFSHYLEQRDFRKKTFLTSGQHHAKIISLYSSSGVFMGNAKTVSRMAVKEAFKEKELRRFVVSGFAPTTINYDPLPTIGWTGNGGSKVARSTTIPGLSAENRKRMTRTKLPFYAETRDGTEFWSPVYTVKDYPGKEEMYLEIQLGESTEATGFVVLTLSHDGLNANLQKLLYQALGASAFCLLLAFFIAYRQAKKTPGFFDMAKPSDLFLEGIHHNVQNMFNLLVCNMAVLKKSTTSFGDEERLKEIIKLTMENSALVKKLRAEETGQCKRKAPLDMNSNVSTMINILRPVIRSEILLETDLASSPMIISSNSMEMDHLILNLVINAKEAISGSGTITLKTESRLSGRKRGKPCEYAMMMVSDDGAGIPAENREKVLYHAFSTKKHGEGLGLWTVNETVKKAGGFVEVESETGKGTAIKVFIPMHGQGS